MTSPTSDNSLIKNDPLRLLQRRFVGGMVAVAALALLNQLVLQPWLIQLTSDAPTINVAGRQRMLSQKLSKAALELTDQTRHRARDAREELRQALADWAVAHRGLQYGDPALGLPANENSQIRNAFQDLEPHFQKMHDAARRLIAADVDEPAPQQLAEIILEEEGKYLPRMHRIVGLFEAESRKRVSHLRIAGWVIVGLILALLFSLVWFAIRPVMRLIEQRVVERTEQLRTMNRQLEREIADRRRAEHRTRELLDQLAHAARLNSLGQMAAGLAHELNQPLGAIVNYAEAAGCHLEQDFEKHEEARKILTRISAAGLRAGAIVHRLRNFIRKEKNARQAVLLPALIAEVIELCEPEARKRGVKIEFASKVRSENFPAPTVDGIQIQQVLVNLIQNAIEALRDKPAAERLVWIVLGFEADDELRIDVIDRGCGFDEEQAETLFAPFFTTRTEGLGMGLAICRSIIQEHGGRFWATSQRAAGRSSPSRFL